ncbi:hypothetical protein L6452_18994 [Arctium lappa]|uniref:Uncharacterized protein n=1 Tax=Arctium lappa TaxID=4217 RepID=A0ACB9B6T5_ARCLA|nr:hypothetical protein L6452_18994 [Arctium lappa]
MGRARFARVDLVPCLPGIGGFQKSYANLLSRNTYGSTPSCKILATESLHSVFINIGSLQFPSKNQNKINNFSLSFLDPLFGTISFFSFLSIEFVCFVFLCTRIDLGF